LLVSWEKSVSQWEKRPGELFIRSDAMTMWKNKAFTENMGNCYRMGYWLMAIGLTITFFE
jgi:hypothetical protein